MDIVAECRLLEGSGFFDAQAYRKAAGLDGTTNASEHYLRDGWRANYEPGPGFEGAFLYPYFRSAGFNGPPAITYVTLQCAGWPTYPTRASAESMVALVRNSGLFDAQGYAARLKAPDIDAVMHYVLVGEQMGITPSSSFDPVYYSERYPDIVRARQSPLGHYLLYGRSEGRRPVSVAAQLTFHSSSQDGGRETVLIVAHQASRTGASILAYNLAKRLRSRYNVVALLLAGGELVAHFRDCCSTVIGPLSYDDWHPVEAAYLVKRMLAEYRISYALVNSIDSRIVLHPLASQLVPSVALVHEFPSHLRTRGEMGRALEGIPHIVFSAEVVAKEARRDWPGLENRKIHVLPQGPSDLPPGGNIEALHRQEESLRRTMRPPGFEEGLVVLGCGTVYTRKGVDLFLSCASAVAALNPRRPVRFVWIGRTLPAETDGGYSKSLSEQIERSGAQDFVAIVDEVSDLEPAYASSDIFFLSSRLDPLPNVAIDSALRGKPVICFEDSGGIGEVLKADPATRMSVVPYLDVQAAARLIAGLANDDVARNELGAATRNLARKAFDMERYVNELDQLGIDSARIMRQRAEDFETICKDHLFDMTTFLGRDPSAPARTQAIQLFVLRAAAFGTNRVPTENFYYRRPCAGFHPQIYAHENSSRYDTSVINPLAHFIRSGKPQGPWCNEVITPDTRNQAMGDARELRAVIHAHFHYPELATRFLGRLKSNSSRCDLLLSTNDDTKACTLRQVLAELEFENVPIHVVPNRGRDIGPMLTEFADELEPYDVVGHFHGKRSLFTSDSGHGESWREFLWQNLLGDMHPMMDIILARFAADRQLGLVFADDPHLPDWDYNLEIAKGLAERMGINDELPPFFNFPVGTMFWARTEALKPFRKLRLAWADYPEEPMPIDGTILHAMERLLPFVARHAGYRFATTHISEITW